ncbi:MAG: ATP-binding protein [Campylobacterales bacterium]|nr:ATP-binding protein [Campylobacterales bacterium]
MSSYASAAALFESSFDQAEYFESMSAEFAKNSLFSLVEANEVALLFLLGEPGVGKTYLLHLLCEAFKERRRIVMASEPFGSPESLMHFLLQEDEASVAVMTLPQMKERALALYAPTPHLIILDEAQLLDERVYEYIRILADTKSFRFLLSMHAHEGKAIVKKPHFATRDHRVITLGLLQGSELRHYLESTLLRHNMGMLAEGLGNKEFKMIERFTQGNFRLLKQMFRRIFALSDHAKTNGIALHSKPNGCIVTMAAIDLGCLDA